MTDTVGPAIFKLGQTNSYLIKCRDGYLAIDTSFPAFYDTFADEIKMLGIELSEIKYLLLTHHHDDHAGFAARLKETSGCRIIAHRNSVEALGSGIMISMNRPLNRRIRITMAIFNKLKHRNFKIAPVVFDSRDIIVEGDDNECLRKIGVEGNILYTPGHTVDSISVVLDRGDAFTGDVCMNFLNFCGIHYRPIWLYDPALVFESWGKIIDSGAKDIYPAHGKPFGVQELIRYKKVYAPSAAPSQ